MILVPAVALIDWFSCSGDLRCGALHRTGYHFGRVDRYGLVFAYVFALMALVGMCIRASRERRCAACIGADLRRQRAGYVWGDFLSLFLFWELAAVSAVFWSGCAANAPQSQPGFGICWFTCSVGYVCSEGSPSTGRNPDLSHSATCRPMRGLPRLR